MLRLQRNRADVLQLCPVEAGGINNIYSQKRKNVTMSEQQKQNIEKEEERWNEREVMEGEKQERLSKYEIMLITVQPR